MNNKLNIIIATGLFPTDIGGPATYVSLLCKELPKKGCKVSVITYGIGKQLNSGKLNDGGAVSVVSKKQNLFFRYFGFFRAVWKLSKKNNIIYAFDLVSVGIPCALVKLLRPKTRLVIRLGGDYQWEKAVQWRAYDNTLEKYYEDKKFSLKEKFEFLLTNFVINSADKIIFNADFLRDIFVKLRSLDPAKATVIKNIIPDIEIVAPQDKPRGKIKILFAGRIIKARNLKRFIDALSDIKKESYGDDVLFDIIGSGPEKEEIKKYVHDSAMDNMVQIKKGISRQELLNKINNYDIVILPSLTDINPNFIIEALILKKHIIITKHTEGYYSGLRNIFLNYINPLDADDISQALKLVIKRIRENKVYDIELASADIIKIGWPLEKVINKHITNFKELI